MNPSSGQARPSPHPGEYADDTFAERQYDSKAPEYSGSQYLRSFVSAPQDSVALHNYHDHIDQGYGSTNDFSQYCASHNIFRAEDTVLHDQQASAPTSSFALQSDFANLRGIEECVESTSICAQSRELGRRETAHLPGASLPHTMHRRSESIASGGPILGSMHSITQCCMDENTAQDEQQPLRQTKYTLFQYRFGNSNAARDHRREGTRFDRLPYRDPETDDTIRDIEKHRNLHVERIYNAMTSGEVAKDNRGSIAMKRWVIEAHYPADLVEAYAHKVFDCLLAQAKDGFRGWVHNDYVADERKGEDIDKDVDCAGRLDNIIMALEHEKTICEDVMNSACQIRMFVNAPRAYANRKHQNRVGNSKRGRTKDTPDPNPRPTKTVRPGGRRTRARSTTASDMPSLRGTTPQHQQSLQHVANLGPYYMGKAFSNASSSPITENQLALRPTPAHSPMFSAARNSFGQHSINALSPPPTSSPRMTQAPQSHIPRVVSMPPHHNSPLMPQPPLSRSHCSSGVPPVEAEHVKADATFSNWHDMNNLDESLETSFQQNQPPIDPLLRQWGFTGLPQDEQVESSDLFDRSGSSFVNPQDIERRSSREFGGGSDLRDIWGMQLGMQDFHSADATSENRR